MKLQQLRLLLDYCQGLNFFFNCSIILHNVHVNISQQEAWGWPVLEMLWRGR